MNTPLILQWSIFVDFYKRNLRFLTSLHLMCVGKYGVAQPWYFLVLPSYWCGGCCCDDSTSDRGVAYRSSQINAGWESPKISTNFCICRQRSCIVAYVVLLMWCCSCDVIPVIMEKEPWKMAHDLANHCYFLPRVSLTKTGNLAVHGHQGLVVWHLMMMKATCMACFSTRRGRPRRFRSWRVCAKHQEVLFSWLRFIQDGPEGHDV